MFRRSSWALGLVTLLSGVALAGPNAGGTLIVHDPGIAYTGDSSSYPSPAPSCAPSTVDAQIPVEYSLAGWVWKVYAAFPAGSAPRLKALVLGATFDPGVYVVAGGLPSASDFEISQGGWPNSSGGGVGISFGTVQTATVVEVYWFGGYGASGAIWRVAPHPTQEMLFVDDSIPPQEDAIFALSSIGFGLEGSTICPGAASGGACCDPSGGCEFVTESSCHTGDWRVGVGCDPNPCPQPPGPGACCLPSGACLFLPESACDTHAWMPGVACDPNPCPQPPHGACCPGEGVCLYLPESECSNGTWQEGVECVPNPCPPAPSGACCLSDGSCVEVPFSDCPTSAWMQDVPCVPNPCPPPPPQGACCYPQGWCLVLSQDDCDTGDWREGVVCSPNPCPQPPLGACCLASGACLVLAEHQCSSGDWREGIACEPNPCPLPEVGACCTHMACVVVAAQYCDGTWLGPGVSCLPNPCCAKAEPPAPAPAADEALLSSPGPGSGRIHDGSRTNPCPGSELRQNDDGSFENAFTWSFAGVQPPDYGAFAEGYPEVTGTVCGIEVFLTRWGMMDGLGAVDLYVWDYGPNGNPGSVLSVTTCVTVAGVGYWPQISTHDFDCADGAGGNGVFVGYWPRSFAWGLEQFGVAMDEDGPGGNPRTNVAPGIGYPTGWQHPSLVGYSLQAFGLRPWVLGGVIPVERTSWGRIKEMYHP